MESKTHESYGTRKWTTELIKEFIETNGADKDKFKAYSCLKSHDCGDDDTCDHNVHIFNIHDRKTESKLVRLIQFFVFNKVDGEIVVRQIF